MSAIDRIIQERNAGKTPPPAAAAPAGDGDKFFSVLLGDAMAESFMELRFSNGLKSAFAYSDLSIINHDPEQGSIDLFFGSFLITVKGRGLEPIYEAAKLKRLAWVKEADSALEDHKGNTSFVEEIVITPPEEFAPKE